MMLVLLLSGLFVATAAPAAENGWLYRLASRRDGAPASMHGVVQAKDGFLWIAAEDGLFRFDGIRYERVPAPAGDYVQSDSIDAIVALQNGDIWLGHDWGGLSLVRGNRQTSERFALPGYVMWMGQGPRGTAWALASQFPGKLHIARFDGAHWRLLKTIMAPIADRIGAADPSGNLWILIGGQLSYFMADSQAMIPVAKVDALAKLARASDGKVWLASNGKLMSLSSGGKGDTPVIGPTVADLALTNPAVLAFDHQQDFWIADAAGHLRRFTPDRRTPAGQPAHWVSTGALETSPLGVGSFDRALFDAEQNLWLVTNVGLGKVRRAAFFAPPDLGRWAGWQTDQLAIRDGLGAIWLTRNGQLLKVDRNGAFQVQPFRIPPLSVPCASRTGGLWVSDGNGHLRVVGGPARPVLSIKDAKGFGKSWGAYCIEDGAGQVWVSDVVLRRAGPNGLEDFPLDNKIQGSPCTFAIDRQGRLLVYRGRGSLYRTDGKTVEEIWRKEDLSLGFIDVMFQGDRYLYLGGDRGVVRYDGRRFQMLSRERFPYLAAISGITQTPAGDTWLHGSEGVVRLRTADFDRAFTDPQIQPKAAMFGPDDGLEGESAYWNMSSLVSDQGGRLYAMTGAGLAVSEPGGAPSNPRVPPVVITDVRVGDHHLAPTNALALPAGVSRLEVDYTALSLVEPSRVRFRYRLFGVDADWVDAGSARIATYTSLAPGAYRFQVIAANNDGVWNRTGAELRFSIAPTFVQSWVFKLLCALLLVGAAFLLHRLRLAYIARRIRARMDVQLSERERIARNLHDTLLQSVQGLMIRFHSLSLRPNLDRETQTAIDDTLNEVEATLVESREQVAGLRRARTIGLSRQIEAAVERMRPDPAIVAIETAGDERLLEPLVCEEGARIACEAITNAIRHASASQISATITYRTDSLCVCVCDDGTGIDDLIVRNGGRDGHFGLRGMRERAERAGGRLQISSAANGGTTVTFEVSARLAYLRSQRGKVRWPNFG